MKYLFALEGWLLAIIMLLSVPAKAREFKNYWKFGMNLGLNEAGVSCKPINQPRQAGIWLSGANGSCQGAWSSIYNQYIMRSPSNEGGAWARFDFDLHLSLNGDRSAAADAMKIGNSNLFVEVGQLLPLESLLWIGRRGYRWEGLWLIGMTIVNTEGPGFGIYNIDVGQGRRAALAAFYTVSYSGGPVQSVVDFRLEEISLWDGKLGFVSSYTASGARDSAAGTQSYAPMHGYKFALLHKRWAPSGSHQFASLYARGLFGVIDSADFEQGPLADSMGPWRNNDLFSSSSPPELRDAVQESSLIRIGEQLSWYPQSQVFSVDAAIGWQKADFGGWRYAENGIIRQRPAMQSFAVAVRPIWQIKSTLELESLLGYVSVIDGFGYRHRTDDGNLQETLRPLDQNLCNLYFSLNMKPMARWQQKFSIYSGYSWWNRAMRRDVSNGLYPDRSSGWYTGLSSYWEI